MDGGAPAEGCCDWRRYLGSARTLSLPRNGAGWCLPAARSRTVLWLLQRKSCRRRLQVKGARTHVAAWLDRHEVGGQKGQMGIFANATLVTDRSHPMELSLGAKRRAGRSGRRVRLG